jgi:hypothetical protein
MKIRRLLVTLGVVVALGVGIFLWSVAQQDEPAQPAAEPTTTVPPAAAATTLAATPAPLPPPPPPPQPVFPPKADYVGTIPTAHGNYTVDITIDGGEAIAYACDGNTVEVLLRGGAVNGAVNLANNDNTSRLDGRLQGNAIVGTLLIGERKLDFTADTAQPPAGLYVYENGGVRTTWIIDANGGVTGVQRQADGSTAPAPALSPHGTAVIHGHTVTATKVDSPTDV